MSLLNSLDITGEFYGITTTKGDILVNDGTKNVRIGIGTDDYVLTADSTAPNGLKWAAQTGGSGPTNTVDYYQYTLSTLPLSTNYTSPVSITEFQNTPLAGSYVILCSLSVSITKSNQSAQIGFYKNGVLISGSNKTIDPSAAGRIMFFYAQFLTTFSGTDVFTVRYNSDTTNSSIIIYEGNLLLIKFTNSSQLFGTTEFSTNSTSPIEISDLSTTPNAGVFLILVNTTYSLSKNNRTITLGIYKDSSLINNASRTLGGPPNIRLTSQLSIVGTFTGSELLNVRLNSSNADCDATTQIRNLILVPLS